MTGYGECRRENEDHYAVVELASVNNRHLEINFSLSERLALERRLERRVRDRIERGKVDVLLHSDLLDRQDHAVDVDEALVERYLELGRTLTERHPTLEETFTVPALLSMEGVLSVRERPADVDAGEGLLTGALEGALDQLVEMRRREGERLRGDLADRIETIRQQLGSVRERFPESLREYRESLEGRMESLVTYESDEQRKRVQDEIKMYAEKRDISEEVVRIDSHLDQFEETLGSEGPCGKRLEFLLQEIQREVNTVGAKADDAEISQRTVTIKSELEKCREQVRNVE